VPQQVIGLAEEVVTACSEVQFCVEHTVASDSLKSNLLAWINDPILWVERGSERYAIAVWDEEGQENLVLSKADASV